MYSGLIHVGRFFSSQYKVSHSIKKMMITSIALSQLALPGFSHAASRVFYDNFENGEPSSAWNSMDCPVVTRAVDGGGPQSGAYMLQCNWNGAVAWNNPNSKQAGVLQWWPYQREMFLRMWLRLDQDMDYKDGAKLLRLGFGGECEYVIQRDPVTQSGGTHEWWGCGGSLILINSWGPHNFEDHQWHKLEVYIKHDTNGSNGEIKTWQDGKLTTCCGYPHYGRTTLTENTHWYPFNLVSNWSSNPGWEHDATNHWYIDNVEIYTDQGSGATGSMADATIGGTSGGPSFSSLSKPKNLRVLP